MFRVEANSKLKPRSLQTGNHLARQEIMSNYREEKYIICSPMLDNYFLQNLIFKSDSYFFNLR